MASLAEVQDEVDSSYGPAIASFVQTIRDLTKAERERDEARSEAAQLRAELARYKAAFRSEPSGI